MSVEFKNLVEMWEQSSERYAPREVFGTKSNGAWQWITYAEFRGRVDAFRAGLASIGVGRGDRVGIVANNCVEWAVAAYATFGLRATFVPMYEAQAPDDWAFILADCGAKVVIGSTPEVFAQLLALRPRLPALEHVLGIAQPTDDTRSFAAIAAKGAAQPRVPDHPDADEPASFVYTSGTTGQPKGVILTHKNICSNVQAAGAIFALMSSDRSLAFLPWAHSFGQTAELHMLFSLGCAMALNDHVPNLVANLAEVKPTILIALPRIFNRIYDGVNKQMRDKPKVIQALFHSGIRAAAKKRRGESITLLEGITVAAAERLIFSKVRARFGGRLRFSVSGSAALSKEVAEFVDALGIDVYEGYGLTEASPVVSANYPGHSKIGSVGRPLPGVRVEIDRAVTADERNGEIVVYGDNVMQGYHNRPEEERQMLKPDRGLRTGDMGYLDADGFLYITGRIKEQYKLENGRYVVPSPLEEELKLSQYVLNVMLYGANKPYNVALIVLDEEALQRWAHDTGHATMDATSDPAVRDLIRAELTLHSKTFKGYELPKAFLLIREDFTVENGFLTPSLKLRRDRVLSKYAAALEDLYSSAS